MARPAGSADPPAEVLCAACGAWFEPAAPSARLVCPLCAAPLVLGELRRARRRVPHRGGVDPDPAATTSARRAGAAKAVAVCAGVLLLVFVLWQTLDWIGPLVRRLAERNPAADRTPR